MHADLLEQAHQLAQLDPGRPRQANLRRAVSAAYYSMFHFLVDQSCRGVIGAQHVQAAYRHVLGRAFSHSVMKDACKSFSGGTLKSSVNKGLPQSFTIPVEVANIAATFVEVQDMRHAADYDLTERFLREEVLGVIQQADRAVRRFQKLTASNEKTFFLACLWAWKTLTNR